MNWILKTTATLVLVLLVSVGCTKPKEPYSVSGNYNGHDYVDLGLPSGTLWATCNIGAETPEVYGDYFAWGETEPKDIYDWSTYKYCVDGDEGQLTKYCSNAEMGYNGFVDGLYQLESSDDAARFNWGEGWRMPTGAEGVELLQECSHQWDTINGVRGLLVTGLNGNTLFIPSAGGKGDFPYETQDYWAVGRSGYYWVSQRGIAYNNMMVDEYEQTANYFVFAVGCYDGGRAARCQGLPVRPVLTKQQ